MLKKYDNDIGRVVYFVAESHVDRRIRNPEVFVKTNDLDTAEILNYAKKTTWELQDGIFEENKMFLQMKVVEYHIIKLIPYMHLKVVLSNTIKIISEKSTIEQLQMLNVYLIKWLKKQLVKSLKMPESRNCVMWLKIFPTVIFTMASMFASIV